LRISSDGTTSDPKAKSGGVPGNKYIIIVARCAARLGVRVYKRIKGRKTNSNGRGQFVVE